MTAKEYLSLVKSKQDRIAEKEDYITRLRDSLSIAGINYDDDRVQSSPDLDKFSKIFADITEAEEDLKVMKGLFVSFKVKVIQMIYKLPNENHKRVLMNVYIDYMNLSKCAYEMNYSYDYVRELHVNALKSFENNYPTELRLNPTL